MIRWTQYRNGSLAGVLYEFTEAGEFLPMHNHRGRGSPHNVVVLSGSVRVNGPAIEMIGRVGDVLDFDCNEDHAVTALEPKTRTLHLLTGSVPESFQAGITGVGA